MNETLAKVKIAEDAKKGDGDKKKPPTMRKKSIKKKKMTDEEIMDALSKLFGNIWWFIQIISISQLQMVVRAEE